MRKERERAKISIVGVNGETIFIIRMEQVKICSTFTEESILARKPGWSVVNKFNIEGMKNRVILFGVKIRGKGNFRRTCDRVSN